MPEIETRIVGLQARPGRVAVLVDQRDSDWETAFIGLMEWLCTLWGGQYSLIVPTDGQTIAEPFLDLLEAFDPDYITVYQRSVRDLEGLNHERFELEKTRIRAELAGQCEGIREDDLDRLVEGRLGNPIGPFRLGASVIKLILSRTVPFFKDNRLGYTAKRGQQGGKFLTCLSTFLGYRGEPGLINPQMIEPQDLPVLWYASVLGRISADAQVALGHNEVSVQDLLLSGGMLTDFTEVVLSGDCASFHQNEPEHQSQLEAMLQRSTSLPFQASIRACNVVRDTPWDVNEPVSLVVGRTVSDFCLYFALHRMTGGKAVWLPCSTEQTVPNTLRRSLDLALGGNPLEVRSLSLEQEAAGKIVSSLNLEHQSPRSIKEVIASPVYLLNGAESREAIQLVDSQLPGWLRTPRLERTLWRPELRWVTEAILCDYAVPRLPNISNEILKVPNYDGQYVRPTQKGIAYYCPDMMVSGGARFDSAVAKPTLSLLTSFQVTELLARRTGWSIRISDKGAYQRTFQDKVGGLEVAASILRDPQAWAILSAYLGRKSDRGSIFLSGIKRTFLEVSAAGIHAGNGEVAAQLLDRWVLQGLLRRGLILQCAHCRFCDWYSFDELKQEFVCHRCSRSQTITRESWRTPAEPHTYYALDEMIFQAFANNAQAVVLALDFLRMRSPRRFQHSSEIEFEKGGDPSSKVEVDICCMVGDRHVIGEAKTIDRLDQTEAKEKLLLSRYALLAQDLGANEVVFATTSEWRPKTKELANSASFQARVTWLDKSDLRPAGAPRLPEGECPEIR